MKHKNLIITFTRNPELGKVKTRLAKTIGDVSALAIYEKLLEHTERVLHHLNCDKAVYYSVKIREDDIWDSKIYQKHLQGGNDLGLRMYYAFQKAFENEYEKIIIVGSDLFDLDSKTINKAFDKLSSHDVVIGPAEDGGYYLLGMKTMHENVFENKVWGTDSVFIDTLNNLKQERVFLLETLNDIDVYSDLEKHSELKKLIQ